MANYFASFIPAAEGGCVVLFKDFGSVVSQGENIAECVEMAEDLLSMLADEYTMERKKLPHRQALLR